MFGKGPPATAQEQRPLRTWSWNATLIAALFATALGARLWLLANYATPLPFLDQWDAEAATLLKPWVDGNLRVADLLQPHNEHRPVSLRLLVLSLTWLNGQWDSLVQMAVNAIGCATIAVLVAIAAARAFDGKYRLLIFASAALWSALPYSQENTLWGFQSQFYFLLGFSLLALWNLTFHPPFSFAWIAGIVSAALACFSMASGFLAPAAVVALLALRSINNRRIPAASIVTGAACLLIIALAAYFRVEVPHHEPLKAQSLAAWLHALARCLAWPFSDYPLAGIPLNAPVLLLAIRYVRERNFAGQSTPRHATEMILALSLWVCLQAAAMAYARAAEPNMPASRYLDILALGPLSNFLACLALASASADHRRSHARWAAAGMCWALPTLVGAAWASHTILRAQAGRADYLRLAETNLRGYMATSEERYLHAEVPHPDISRLRMLLDSPAFRTILPAGIRAPLPVEKAADVGAAFVRSGIPETVVNASNEQVWGSFSAAGDSARGTMRSQPLTTRFPFLQVDIAGRKQRALSVDLVTPDQRRSSQIKRGESIAKHWRVGIAATPAETFELVATDDSDKAWLAFRQPREVGRLSVYASRLVKRGKSIFVIGCCLWVVALLPLDRLFNKVAFPLNLRS